jgi:tetratricopeptide (TPR) repeat protein
MRASLAVAVLLAASPFPSPAQAPGKFPPDSLINTQVIPHGTPVMQVVGTMRDVAFALGVRCTFCHVGTEEMPLAQVDFASDEKRNKLVARQMMRMVQEVNRRLDTIPEPGMPALDVTCATCHRGVSRPVPLATLISETATAAGADSATRTYRALRERYHGRDAYDFGEGSLNSAALRAARAGKTDEALAILRLNEEQFPTAVSVLVARGNVYLVRSDTTAAAEAFREALRREPRNGEARQRLRAIGREP